jgi:DNA-binding NtrC family response regulator
MLRNTISTTNLILHDLDDTLAAQFRNAASQPGRTFRSTSSTSECISAAERQQADIVFCNSDRNEYKRLLDALQRSGLQLPVVVVSRLPETSEWLDALDAGAADYCAAPFERQHISWLVQSALLAGRHVPVVASSH